MGLVGFVVVPGLVGMVWVVFLILDWMVVLARLSFRVLGDVF